MCLEIGSVDHDRLGRGARSGQSFHHPQKHAPLAPPLPPVVEGLVRSVLLGRIAPTLPVAVYEKDFAQHPSVITRSLPRALKPQVSNFAASGSVTRASFGLLA